MKLNFTVSDALENRVRDAYGQIEYSVPFDIERGSYIEGGTFIVTATHLVCAVGDDVLRAVPLSGCGGVKCEAMVGCGVLTAQTDGTDKIIVSFSQKHIARYSYLARCINNLIFDKPAPVKSQPERLCSKCGAPLGTSTVCPECGGKSVTLNRFLSLCRPYMFKLVLASTLMVAASACSLYIQQLLKIAIDDYLAPVSGEISQILWLFFTVLALMAGSVVFTIAKNLLCVRLGATMSMDLREKLFCKVQQLSMSFIGRTKPGLLINRISFDADNIRDFMQQTFGNLMSSLFTMVGSLILMLIINWKLALLTVLFVPAVLIFSRVFHRRIMRLFRAQARKGDAIKGRMQDVVSGIRVVKAFGKEASESRRFDALSTDYAQTQSRNETFWALFFPLLTFTMGVGINFVTYFGGLEVLKGSSMTVGTLMQFISYATMFNAPLGRLANLPRMFSRMLTSLSRVYDILDEQPEIVNSEKSSDLKIDGHIEFKNVSFSYNKTDAVLEDINLDIAKGEMIGLCGSSGVGKSTLINLIMRLYDVDEGEILIDGVNIADIDLNSLHSQIGVVLQETFLFSGTILANLRFVKPDATYEQIVSACKSANAHDFICALPDGYNTYIGERGYTLSGGERQRIAIARAILCDPRILILDEATSSLDTHSEVLIQQALKRLCEGRTTIAIAHRLSTLRNANRIVVLENHTVKEVGSHDKLMADKGIYYNLVTAQNRLHRIEK